MSDDRFTDANTFKRHVTTQSHVNAPLIQSSEASGASNERVTLEECLERAIKEGRESEVIPLIDLLPESSKEKYRALWKRVKGGV